MDFQADRTDAGLALALGVQEVRPVDLVTAYGTLANGGRAIGHTTILPIRDRAGNDVVDAVRPARGQAGHQPAGRLHRHRHPGRQHGRRVNPFWGKFAIDGPERRRPATLKTGTNNDAKDLNAYGYIAPPTAGGPSRRARTPSPWASGTAIQRQQPGLDAGGSPLFSIDVSTYVWQGFLQEASAPWPETDFMPPADGLVQAEVDPWTGFLARPGGPAVSEWFLAGTEPRERARGRLRRGDPDQPGRLRGPLQCVAGRRSRLAPARSDGAPVPPAARTAPGRATSTTAGSSRTGASWGRPRPVAQGCGSPSPSPSCFVLPTPDPSTGVVPSFEFPSPSGSGGRPAPLPAASSEPSASPSGDGRLAFDRAEPDAERAAHPTPEPTPPPTPEPTPVPTPEPTPTPTADPTPAPTWWSPPRGGPGSARSSASPVIEFAISSFAALRHDPGSA